MIATPDDVSFAARKGFDRPLWRAAAIAGPVAAGVIGTAVYVDQARLVWGFLFVLWFVVLDVCLIGGTMFRQPRPPVASRLAYCAVALAGGCFGAIEHNQWGGAIPILTMLVAVLAALVLEQLFAMGRGIARFFSRA